LLSIQTITQQMQQNPNHSAANWSWPVLPCFRQDPVQSARATASVPQNCRNGSRQSPMHRATRETQDEPVTPHQRGDDDQHQRPRYELLDVRVHEAVPVDEHLHDHVRDRASERVPLRP
jgi:hypothetical protein